MTPERWARIKSLFVAAAELPEAERAAFLTLEAAGDPELESDVRSLLDSHDTSDDFLERIPASLSAAALDASDGAVGQRIGAYRLVEMIGTGGMGDVYKAVRDDDEYRAEVAIKLMRADVRNPLAEQRFRTERQILAALDHRNIARLLDGGATSRGLPYVVMELVAGEPIDRYCEAKSLDTRDRVRLFLQVCAAVSFAHQHLVVHRDLKPTNILVTADGSVKLLDFGIAKLLEPETVHARRTDDTRTQLRAMTLDYASPEQVSGGTVTTSSDVYSLGVVLYKLLTSESPYGARVNDAQRIAAILGDTSPTRPSAVRTVEQRPHQIDADLDTILLMALRKEPTKRYGSVEQLANDLRAYLNGFPVQARRGTTGYRLGKFVRRNRVPIGAVVLVVAALAGGLGLALREAREADRQRLVAQRHFNSVRSLANELIEFNKEIEKLDDSTRAQEILVKTSLQYLDTLYQGASDDPALQEEVGAAYAKVANIQGSQMGANRGDPKAALASYAKSNALLEPLLAKDPGNVKVGAILADSYMRQSRTKFYTDGAQPALALAERAVQLSESSAAGFATDALHVATTGDSYALLGQTLGTLGRVDESRVAISKLISITEEFLKRHPDDEMGQRNLAKAYINSAIADDPRETPEQRRARAEPLLRKALTIQQRLVQLDPKRDLYSWNLAETQYNLGDILFDAGATAQALDFYRTAVTRLVRHDPDDARAVLVSSMADVSYAKTLVKVKRHEEALPVLDRVEPLLRKNLRDGRTIQNEYFVGMACIYRGLVHEARAGAPGLDAAERRVRLRLARASLTEGADFMANVNKTFDLVGSDKLTWDDALAGLARVDAALK